MTRSHKSSRKSARSRRSMSTSSSSEAQILSNIQERGRSRHRNTSSRERQKSSYQGSRSISSYQEPSEKAHKSSKRGRDRISSSRERQKKSRKLSRSASPEARKSSKSSKKSGYRSISSSRERQKKSRKSSRSASPEARKSSKSQRSRSRFPKFTLDLGSLEPEPSRRKTSDKKKVTIEKQPKYIEVGKFLIFLFQSVNYIKFVFLTPILMFLIFLLQSVDYKILFVLFYLIPILKDSTAEQAQVRYLLELIRKINKGKKGEQNPDDMIFTPGVFDKALGFKQSPPKKPIIKKSKHKEYGVASSSKLTSKSAYKPIVISSSDENEDDEIKRHNKKKQHKKHK